MSQAHQLLRMRGELRVIGRGFMLGPPLLVAPLLPAAVGFEHRPGTRAVIEFAAWSGVQVLLPLFAGMLAAGLITSEAAHEIQLALPERYGRTARVRFLLLFGWCALVAATAYGGLAGAQSWPATTPFPASSPLALIAGLVGCLAPLGWCCALGWSGAIVLRSASASRTLLALASLGIIAASTGAGTPGRWVLVQLGYLVTGGLALATAGLCLRAPDRLFAHFAQMEEHG